MDFSGREVKRNRWFYSIELIVDLLIIFVSYFIGFRMHRVEFFEPGAVIPNGLWQGLAYICLIALVIFLIAKTYQCGMISYMDTMINLVISIFVIAFLAVILDYMIKGIGIYRRTAYYAVLAQTPMFFIAKAIFINLHNAVIKPKPCIVIADTLEQAGRLCLDLSESKRVKIEHLIDQNTEDMQKFMQQAMQVYMSADCKTKVKRQVMEYCAINDIDFAIVPSFEDIVVNSADFDNASDILFLSTNIKHDVETRFIKRVIDILASSLMIIVLSPLMLLAVILIKIQDSGKVIYSQERLTRGNRVFSIYKFRTMIENAEKKTGAVLAKADDDRITKIGKFLRSTRIDELPQLINVLKGDMSLVGPRPERPDIFAMIVQETPEFLLRTIVKAGLTGIAQTKGKYSTGFKSKLLFDLYYVNNFSILLDFKILFNTIKVVFSPSASEGVMDDTLEQVSSIDILKSKGYTIKNINDNCISVEKTNK